MFSDAMYQNNPLQQKGMNTVKKSFSSNSALTLIILYGAVFLISLISFIFTLSNLSDALYKAGSLINNYSYGSIYYQQMASQLQGTITIIGIVALAISALPLIGLLVTFIKSKNPSDMSNPNSGLTVLFVSGIINTILSAVILLMFIIVFFNAITSSSSYSSSNYYYKIETAIRTTLIFIFLICIAIFIVILLLCIGMALSAYSAKRSIRDNILYTKGWKLTRVSSIILACLMGLTALLSIGSITENFFSWLNVALFTAILITLAVFITGYLRNIFIFTNGGFVPPVNNTNTYYNSTNPNAYPQQIANQNYYAQPQQPTNYYAPPQQPTTNQSYYSNQPQQANQNYYNNQPQQANQNYYNNQPQQANQNYYNNQSQQQTARPNYYSNPATADKPQPVNLNKTANASVAVPVSSTTATEKPVSSNAQSTVCPACNTAIVGKSLFCPHCGHKL